MIRYAIKRLIRYAKYAAVGAIVAAIGGGLLGTLGSGIAFFAAPGIGAGMAIGVATAVLKVCVFRSSLPCGGRLLPKLPMTWQVEVKRIRMRGSIKFDLASSIL